MASVAGWIFGRMKKRFLLVFPRGLDDDSWLDRLLYFLFWQLLKLLYQLVLPFGSYQKRRLEDIRSPPLRLYSTM